MKHGRLHWFEPAELTAHARDLYDRIAHGPRAKGAQAFPLTDAAGRLNGPFNALLVTPELGAAVQELGRTIRYAGSLSPRAREIAILEQAAQRQSEFEWYAHERLGAQAGLTADEIAALRKGTSAPSLSAQETLVRSVVRELIRTRDLADERYDEAESVLGAAVLAEVVMLVGYYDLIALSLRTFRTPLPDGAVEVFSGARDGGDARSLDDGHAAVADQFGAGDETREVAREK